MTGESRPKPFDSERQLMDAALRTNILRSLLSGAQYYGFEVGGLFGIPDLVVARRRGEELECIAFEMKLSKWTRALEQAFRYKSFAERVFVVIDAAFKTPALAQLSLFQRYNIGLASVSSDGEAELHYLPRREVPFSDSTARALQEIVSVSAAA